MLRTSFIAMYKNLGVWAWPAFGRLLSTSYGPAEQLSEPSYSPCLWDWVHGAKNKEKQSLKGGENAEGG